MLPHPDKHMLVAGRRGGCIIAGGKFLACDLTDQREHPDASTRRLVIEGLRRLIDWQDAAWAGDYLDRLSTSPQLEGFRARGIEVLLLPDQVDNFWTTVGVDHEGKPFKSVTQGGADLTLIPLAADAEKPVQAEQGAVDGFLAFARDALASAVSDVRVSERLTTSAVCLVAPESGMDRQLEKLLASAGQLPQAALPILEINPGHALIQKLAMVEDGDELKADLAHLLLDQARIADGEQPGDARAFAERLDRLMRRAVG